MIRSMIIAGSAFALSLGLVTSVVTPAQAANKEYKNCTALNKDYKHGVGKSGARDKTSGTRVTNFKRSTKIYKKNKKSDRDKDGIACEKK